MRNTSPSILNTRRSFSLTLNGPGGCFCHLLRVGGCSGSGRVILSGEGDSVHPHKPLQARRRQFHPPATITPSRDISALQGTSTFQSELLDSQFQILRGVEETRVRDARKTAIRKHLSELNPDLMNRLGATTAAYLATSCG